MADKRLTLNQVFEIVDRLAYPGFTWHVRGNFGANGPVTLHATFLAPDVDAHVGAVEQTTRKWLLSQWMVPGEIVQTALKCVLTAIEHEAREQFTYRGERVFGPHFSIDELVRLCVEKRTEVRA